jgi:predicted phage terminase large subunit-like protein
MWNLGRILVPGGEDRPEWVDDFLDEVTNFTGVKDAHDDQVDALAAAFDQLHDGDDGEAVIF